MHYVLAIVTTVMLWVLSAATSPAEEKDRSRWANVPPEVRAWYANAELTPEAQKRFGWKNCCDHSDVVQAQFEQRKVDGKYQEEWYYKTDGMLDYKRIPPDIIHYGVPAPYGKATLFVYSGRETCFYPPAGGI